jgi:hypothetical protein
MSSADLHDVTGDIRVTVRAVPGPPDPWPSVNDVMPLAPVDQNGEIARSFLRRRPVRIVAGRIDGGYTSAFEVICRDCGDNPFLDYSEVSPRLQRLRGPYTLREGFAAYEKHLAAADHTRTEGLAEPSPQLDAMAAYHSGAVSLPIDT